MATVLKRKDVTTYSGIVAAARRLGPDKIGSVQLEDYPNFPLMLSALFAFGQTARALRLAPPREYAVRFAAICLRELPGAAAPLLRNVALTRADKVDIAVAEFSGRTFTTQSTSILREWLAIERLAARHVPVVRAALAQLVELAQTDPECGILVLSLLMLNHSHALVAGLDPAACLAGFELHRFRAHLAALLEEIDAFSEVDPARACEVGTAIGQACDPVWLRELSRCPDVVLAARAPGPPACIMTSAFGRAVFEAAGAPLPPCKQPELRRPRWVPPSEVAPDALVARQPGREPPQLIPAHMVERKDYIVAEATMDWLIAGEPAPTTFRRATEIVEALDRADFLRDCRALSPTELAASATANLATAEAHMLLRAYTIGGNWVGILAAGRGADEKLAGFAHEARAFQDTNVTRMLPATEFGVSEAAAAAFRRLTYAQVYDRLNLLARKGLPTHSAPLVLFRGQAPGIGGSDRRIGDMYTTKSVLSFSTRLSVAISYMLHGGYDCCVVVVRVRPGTPLLPVLDSEIHNAQVLLPEGARLRLVATAGDGAFLFETEGA